MNDFKLNINKNILPIGSSNKVNTQDKPHAQVNSGFGKIFEEQLQQQQHVKFSKHAKERLATRNVELTKEDIENISKAVEKAAQKGIKDTLILLGNTALIANVRSKTIITAATEDTLKDNIFTNIDGAIIL